MDNICPSGKAKVKSLYFREKTINHKLSRANGREISCKHYTLISYNKVKNSLVQSLSRYSYSYIKFLVNISLYVMVLAKTKNVNKALKGWQRNSPLFAVYESLRATMLCLILERAMNYLTLVFHFVWIYPLLYMSYHTKHACILCAKNSIYVVYIINHTLSFFVSA